MPSQPAGLYIAISLETSLVRIVNDGRRRNSTPSFAGRVEPPSSAGVKFQNLAIGERHAGQCLNERPVADQQRRRTVVASGHEGAEGIRPLARLLGGFNALMPPAPRQMPKVMLRKPGCEHIGRTADIAG